MRGLLPLLLLLRPRFLIICFCAVLLLFLITNLGTYRGYGTINAAVQVSSFNSLSGKRIVLDPGHGGPDPGSVGHGVLEKDVVLEVSKMLAELLTESGAQVELTRTGDYDLSGMDSGPLRQRKTLDLKQRVAFINERDPDVFLSIHANAIASPRWSGAQSFYRVGGDAHPDNHRLAYLIQQELRAITQMTRRGVSTDIHQYILNNISVPAATVEVGFLSNPNEANLLSRPEYQQKVAWAIFLGLAKYFATSDYRQLAGFSDRLQ